MEFQKYFETFEQDATGNFLIQDPFGLREVIQPVVAIPHDTTSRNILVGLGTCFQVTPWAWLTAHHVVQDTPDRYFPTKHIGAVGFSPGLIYGEIGFKLSDFFGAISEIQTPTTKGPQPPSFIAGPKEPDIALNIAALRVDISGLKKKPLRSPLPLSKTSVAIGDEVLAIGYPILGLKFKDNPRGIFTERMYGAKGIVKQIEPNGFTTSKPWPSFQIEGNWRAGMSGGPVINKDGQVVGIVSSSFEATITEKGVGFAVDLPPTLEFLANMTSELDIKRPGHCFAYGVFKGEKLIGVEASLEGAKIAKTSLNASKIFGISLNPKTERYIKFSEVKQ